MSNKITYNKSRFNFNPFGGLEDVEILNVIVPKVDLDSIINLINSEDQILIELVGKKGRGKTLHLRCLNLLLEDSSIFYLHKKSNLKDIVQKKSNILLIDSIHHLNLMDRIRLYKTNKKIILTTHVSRKWEYRLAGKPFKIFRFKGIDSVLLKKIIENRIGIASNDFSKETNLQEDEIEQLIKTYHDDYRAILNHLYDAFQIEDYEKNL